MEETDRRAPGVKRVPVDTVVEICGREAGQPAFEAEAVELSGRGMHVRTSYIPPLDTPIVLRFVDRGREVVIEGEVAWSSERAEKGEFGIRFTALDNQGVEVLKDLCGLGKSAEISSPEEPEPVRIGVQPGTSVRLHIEGLGAPMKACVRDGGRRRVNVGSKLEFLRMGRSLTVEDLDQGAHRDARIDGVTVAVEPESGIPQLVVTLRYEGEEATPEPSIVDAAQAAPTRRGAEASVPHGDASNVEDAGDAGDAAYASAYEDEFFSEDYEEDPLRAAFEKLTIRVGKVARQTSGVVRGVGQVAATAMGGALKGAGAVATKLKSAQQSVPAGDARRTTASPRRTAGVPGQRVQPSRRGAPPAAGSAKLRSRAIMAGLVLAVGGAGLFMNSQFSSPDGVPAAALKAEPLALTPAQPGAAAPAPLAMADGAGQAPAGATHPGGAAVVANVPLFGPTAMATAEPEPLSALPKAEPIVEERLGAVEDESFQDEAAPKATRGQEAARGAEAREDSPPKDAEPEPTDVKPWGSGRLHLPTIHRIRLDRAGAALAGTKTPSGFSVIVPEREVMENGQVIAKRDDRIAKVEAKNTAQGAKITFTFRKTVPAYKVRLKKDDVEFFIGAPEK